MISDCWKGYLPLESEFEIRQKPSNGGRLSRTAYNDHKFKRMVKRAFFAVTQELKKVIDIRKKRSLLEMEEACNIFEFITLSYIMLILERYDYPINKSPFQLIAEFNVQ